MARQINIADYTYFIFDFDGVILDSMNIKTDAFYSMYRPFGKTVAKNVARHHVINGGMSRYEKFAIYHKKYAGIELTKKEIQVLADYFAHLVYRAVLKAEFVSGVDSFLKMCKKKKKKCFIVTGTPEKEIKDIVKNRRLDCLFTDIKGAPASKEKNIKTLLKKYKIDKRKAVFFGDAINDWKAAKICDIDFVGVNYPKGKMTIKNFHGLLKRM